MVVAGWVESTAAVVVVVVVVSVRLVVLAGALLACRTARSRIAAYAPAGPLAGFCVTHCTRTAHALPAKEARERDAHTTVQLSFDHLSSLDHVFT